jgi:hypothetical protein
MATKPRTSQPSASEGRREMIGERKTAATVGALFIVATVAGGLSVALLGSILDAPDLLASVRANESQVLRAVLADLILVGAVVASRSSYSPS